MSKFKDKYAEAPVYEIFIEEGDETGIRFISLVQDPAIDIKGMAFNKNDYLQNYFTNVPDKQIVVGPAMVPNKKIARKDPDGEINDGELYFVFFSEDTIQQMVNKFNKGNNNLSINLDHSNQMVDAYIQQNWLISDPYYDKSKTYGYNLPKGTWFVEIKVDDTDQWNEYVKEGGRYSFSVEGLMGQKPTRFNKINDFIDSLSPKEITELLGTLQFGN